jgi:hypothetical protein
VFKMFFFTFSRHRGAWGVSFHSESIDKENLDLLTIGDGVVVVTPVAEQWSVRRIEQDMHARVLEANRGQMLFVGHAYRDYHAA